MLRHMAFTIISILSVVISATFHAITAPQATTNPGPLTVRVTQPGMMTIHGADLTAAGWQLNTINPKRIHVRRAGQDVTLTTQGTDDGRLDAADTVQFLALPSDSRWTSIAVYWISVEAQNGPRGTLATTLPTPYTWEADNRYESRFATVRGDHWYAAELRVGTPYTATLTLPAAAPVGSTLTLGIHNMVARGAHQLRIDQGAQMVGTVHWANTTITDPLTLTLTLPQTIPAGDVDLTFTLTSVGSPADAVLLDQLRFDGVPVPVSTLSPPTLTATEAVDFTTGPNTAQAGADFLIITHHAFATALDPLVRAHQQRGEQVAVIDVQQIYDWASFGEQDPEAIRSFVRTAVANWSPTPHSILLVGAGSVNLRAQQVDRDQQRAARTLLAQTRAHGSRALARISEDLPARTTFIPPYLVNADPLRGEIACDTCYTRLTPGSVLNEPMPELPIGRLPVHTLEEATIVVAKTVQALTAPGGHTWQRRVTVMTDNDRDPNSTPDPAGSFVATAETGIAALPSTMQVQRFYYAPDRPADNVYDHDVSRLRCRVFRTIDGGSDTDTSCARNTSSTQAGTSLLMYVGHGSQWQWASTEPDAEVPYLWYLYDADARHNAQQLPILLSMACLTGDWANPTLMTTDERLLLHSDGGIVASISSTGEGVNTAHAQLLGGVASTLTSSTESRSLGNAHLVGLTRVLATGANQDLLYAFGILGDPDVTLPPITGNDLYLPVMMHP